MASHAMDSTSTVLPQPVASVLQLRSEASQLCEVLDVDIVGVALVVDASWEDCDDATVR
jgi:hypothetical protein